MKISSKKDKEMSSSWGMILGVLLGGMLPGDNAAVNSMIGMALSTAFFSLISSVFKSLTSKKKDQEDIASLGPNERSLIVLPEDPHYLLIEQALIEKFGDRFSNLRLWSSTGTAELALTSTPVLNALTLPGILPKTTVTVRFLKETGEGLKPKESSERPWFSSLPLVDRVWKFLSRWQLFKRSIDSVHAVAESLLKVLSEDSSEGREGKNKDSKGLVSERPVLAFTSNDCSLAEIKEAVGRLGRERPSAQPLKLYRLTRSGSGSGGRQRKNRYDPGDDDDTGSKRSKGDLRWESMPLTSCKTFANTPLCDSAHETLYKDFRTFLNSKELYHTQGRTWKRGFLLYGPPGCGKSSCINAMAREGAMDVFLMDAQAVSNNQEWISALNQVRSLSPENRPHMLVMEDFDRCSLFENIDEEEEPEEEEELEEEDRKADLEDTQKPIVGVPPPRPSVNDGPGGFRRRRYFGGGGGRSKITLDVLLQELEGVGDNEGRVVVFTANRPGKLMKLDKTGALFRPGRIDVQVRLGRCSRSQADRMIRLFHCKDAHLLPPLSESFVPGSVTPADLIHLLQTSLTNLERTVAFLNGRPTTPDLKKCFSDSSLGSKLDSGPEGSQIDGSQAPFGAEGRMGKSKLDKLGRTNKTWKERRLQQLKEKVKLSKQLVTQASRARKDLVTFLAQLQKTDDAERGFLRRRQDELLRARLQLDPEEEEPSSKPDRSLASKRNDLPADNLTPPTKLNDQADEEEEYQSEEEDRPADEDEEEEGPILLPTMRRRRFSRRR